MDIFGFINKFWNNYKFCQGDCNINTIKILRNLMYDILFNETYVGSKHLQKINSMQF